MATLRTLTAPDIPAAIAVLERAGLPGGALNVERFLRWQPDGAWGRLRDGELIGMVMLLRFGQVGFVGCMAVDPAHQGGGIGRLLLEHAHAAGRRAGGATFLLEATPAGERLYRSLGYVAEHETVVVTRSADPRAGGERVDRAELAGMLALDRAATGTPRDVMVGGLLDEAVGVVVRDDAGTAAYGLAPPRPHRTSSVAFMHPTWAFRSEGRVPREPFGVAYGCRRVIPSSVIPLREL